MVEVLIWYCQASSVWTYLSHAYEHPINSENVHETLKTFLHQIRSGEFCNVLLHALNVEAIIAGCKWGVRNFLTIYSKYRPSGPKSGSEKWSKPHVWWLLSCFTGWNGASRGLNRTYITQQYQLLKSWSTCQSGPKSGPQTALKTTFLDIVIDNIQLIQRRYIRTHEIYCEVIPNKISITDIALI